MSPDVLHPYQPATTSDTPPPGALFDRVDFGLSAGLPGIGEGELRALALALFERHLVERPPLSFPAGDPTLKIALGGIPGAPIGVGRLKFVFDRAGTVRLGGRSHLELNGMRALRAVLPDMPLPSFAGDNFIGTPIPLHEGRTLLDLQLDLLRGHLGSLTSGIAECAGLPALAGDAVVRSCELCRDLPIRDADGVARAVAALPSRGLVHRTQRYDDPTSTLVQGDHVTSSWHEGRKRGRVVLKVYPKAPALIRVEASCVDSEAVFRLLGKTRSIRLALGASLTTELPEVLAIIAAALQPSLDDLEEVVGTARAPAPARIGDLVGLAPLLSVAHPAPRIGRPADPETVQAATAAVEALLQAGRFDARGVRANTALRRALDMMAEGPAAVLDRTGPRRTLFVLRRDAAWLMTSVGLGLAGTAEAA